MNPKLGHKHLSDVTADVEPVSGAQQRDSSWPFALLVIAVVASAVGGARSWVPGPWLDEGVTILSAQRSWSSLGRMLKHQDAVHGAYYGLMHGWFEVVNYSPLMLRLPSVLATSVAAVLIAVLGKRLFDPSTGVLAALVYVAMPAVLMYAIEGRAYALGTALVTLSALLLVEALSRQSVVWWFGYAIAAVLTVQVFLFSALVFAAFPLVLSSVGASRQQWARFAASTTVAVLACLPLLKLALSQQGQVAWITDPTARGLLALPREVWYPVDGIALYTAAAWAILAVGVTVLLMSARRATFTTSALGARGVAVLLLGWLLLPGVLLVGVTLLGPNVYVPRYLITTAPALALILGVAVRALRRRVLQGMVLAMLIAVAIPHWASQRVADSKSSTSLAAAQVRSVTLPGDGVLFVGAENDHNWTRLTRYAYPDEFKNTVDLNLGVPFDQSSSLTESDVPLGSAPERLDGIDRVVAIVPPDPDLQGKEDLQTLSFLGFVLATTAEAGDWYVQVWRQE